MPSLEEKTVKELKQMLQDSNLNERGLLSKLKRKQDLVEYLKEHLHEEPEREGLVGDHSSSHTPDGEVTVVAPPTAEKNAHLVKNDDPEPETTDVVPADFQELPSPLQDSLVRRGIASLMPIQKASYKHVASGEDAVLSAPTGQGKTWAFCLPLAARILNDPLLQARAKGKHSSERFKPVSPRILTLVPSRELARQVGKEWSKWTDAPVATVFGGVPLERHVNLLRKGGGAHVVVSTPGRWRELVREGHVDYQHVHVLVLDEADTMLDAADSPDVTAILNQITYAVGQRESYEEQQYQMILVSATVNALVREFALDTMEILPKSKSFITVEQQEFPVAAAADQQSTSSTKVDNKPTSMVEHWYTPVKTIVQPSVAADLITSLAPQLCIIFVPTRSDTETVSTMLSEKLSGSSRVVRALHGDMTQSQRSRSIALIRASQDQPQVLVATDVASRGLDLPNVNLVIQFGIPRVAGKEGTMNIDLYTHRTGRAGRAGTSSNVRHDAIMLYDPAVGEGKLLDDLMQDVNFSLGVSLNYRPIPCMDDLVDGAYRGITDKLFKQDNGVNPDVVSYIADRLQSDIANHDNPEEALKHLATAIVLMANLEDKRPTQEQYCSLLTGDPNDRTLMISRSDDNDDRPIAPPDVTKLLKSLGSGKVGRVIVMEEEGALVDLAVSRTRKLLKRLSNQGQVEGWRIELPTSVPNHDRVTGRQRPTK